MSENFTPENARTIQLPPSWSTHMYSNSHCRRSAKSRRGARLSRTPFGVNGATSTRRNISVSQRPHLVRTPTSSTREPPCLKDLTQTTWKIHKMTPLYKFSPQAAHLKKYSRALSAYVEAESNKDTAVLADEGADKADISVYYGLQTCQDDHKAIQIQLKAKPKFGTNGGPRVVLTAVMSGVDMDQSPDTGLKKYECFTYYPVLMIKGPAKLSEYLKKWLQAQFDCAISPVSFSSLDLTWMLAMWSGGHRDAKPTKPIELVYDVPTECAELSRITLSINSADYQPVWKCIHDNDSNIMTSEEVAAFIVSLEIHFYRLFRIKLSAMSLSRIGTPIVAVRGDGGLKIFSESSVLQVLQHITTVVMSQLEIDVNST